VTLALWLSPGAAHAQVLDVASSLTFTNPNREISDYFGNAMAPVGADKVLVTSLYDGVATGVPVRDGVAYLFRTNGTLLKTFRNPFRGGTFFGHRVDALGANKILIAAHPFPPAPDDGAAVHLFSVGGQRLTTFRSPIQHAADGFGSDVAAVGTDKVLIGARHDSTGVTNTGAAYLFKASGQLLTTFTNPTPAPDDLFGTSLAAVGRDKVVIGALLDDTGANDAGAAYLFNLQGKLLITFTNPTPEGNEGFGYPVSAVGTDKVAIGARHDNTGAISAGSVYLFSTNGALLQTFTNPVPEISARFGYSVAGVGEDKLLIGGFETSRSAYLYRTDGVLLNTFTNSTMPDGVHWFGFSLKPVGIGQVMIGDFETAAAAGETYLFTLNELFDRSRISELVPCSGPFTGGPWKNHTHYVTTLSRVARNLAKHGTITAEERAHVVKAGARSRCGAK
jgi:hypothetical protein